MKKYVILSFLLLFSITLYSQKIKITEVFGTAEVLDLSSNQYNWLKCTSGMILNPKSKIRTGNNSFVKILLEGDKLIIKEHSVVSLQDISIESQGKSIIKLITGKLRGIFKFMHQRNGELLINTPTSIVGIRGTDFVVDASFNGVNKIYVFDGNVEVANIKMPDLTVTVPAYKMTEVLPDLQPKIPFDIPEPILNEYEITPQKTAPIATEPTVTPSATTSPQPVTQVEENPKVEKPIETPVNTKETVKNPEPTPKPTPKPKPQPQKPKPQKPAPQKKKEPWCPDPKLEFHMGFDFQYLNINNKGYGLIALMPEFAICKIGIGLYMPIVILSYQHFFYSKKWYNHNEWDFKSPSDSLHDFIIKFMYIYYGKKGDPFYIRIGTIPDITFGNGFIMNQYSNMLGFPTIRRIGFELGYIYNNLVGIETMCADLGRREIYGGRFLVKPFGQVQMKMLSKFEIGTTLVSDVNVGTNNSKVINWGFDAGMPILTTPLFNIKYSLDWATYSVYAPTLTGIDGWKGSGNFGFATGFRGNLSIFLLRAEYRYLKNGYISEYFDPLYEVEREKKFDKLQAMYNTPSPSIVNGYLVELGTTISGAGKLGFRFQEYYGDSIQNKARNKARVYLTLQKGVIPYGYGTFTYDKLNVVGLTGKRSLFGNLYDENTVLTFDGAIKLVTFVYMKIYYQRTYAYDSKGNLVSNETYSTGLTMSF